MASSAMAWLFVTIAYYKFSARAIGHRGAVSKGLTVQEDAITRGEGQGDRILNFQQ
jgi:hypothetical protein